MSDKGHHEKHHCDIKKKPRTHKQEKRKQTNATMTHSTWTETRILMTLWNPTDPTYQDQAELKDQHDHDTSKHWHETRPTQHTRGINLNQKRDLWIKVKWRSMSSTKQTIVEAFSTQGLIFREKIINGACREVGRAGPVGLAANWWCPTVYFCADVQNKPAPSKSSRTSLDRS